jgi:hypothetical protein
MATNKATGADDSDCWLVLEFLLVVYRVVYKANYIIGGVAGLQLTASLSCYTGRMKKYRLLLLSVAVVIPIVLAKFIFHDLGWEVLTLGSLHTSVVTGTFFVIGFILSATIADYKESEKIPADFAAAIENMYEDVRSTHKAYPAFNLKAFEKLVHSITASFADDVRHKKHQARLELHRLNATFTEMERAGVPANFIVKLKQQQAAMVRALFRVQYIQRIMFLPSAILLARSIVCIAIALLVFTEIEPFYGGMALVAIISYIMVFVLLLIQLISVPFQPEGKTKDDVSLFLINDTEAFVQAKRAKTAKH